MRSDLVLQRVAKLHGALIVLLVSTLQLTGQPLRGALLGGGLAGLSFVTFWVVARSITEPRRKRLAAFLGVTKVTLYLGLSAAVLSGRLAADARGFALGVSCFVVAVVVAAFASRPHVPTIDFARN